MSSYATNTHLSVVPELTQIEKWGSSLSNLFSSSVSSGKTADLLKNDENGKPTNCCASQNNDSKNLTKGNEQESGSNIHHHSSKTAHSLDHTFSEQKTQLSMTCNGCTATEDRSKMCFQLQMTPGSCAHHDCASLDLHSCTTRLSGFTDVKNQAIQTPLLARSKDVALVPQYHSMQFDFTDFEYDSILGSGITAICVAARERRTNKPVAIKILSKALLVERQQEHCLLNEIELQSHLCHPNIVPILTWFHDRERVALVMEYCSQGDLLNYLANRRSLIDERFTSRLMFDVVWSLRYCHANKIAHLDLKPENIMVHDNRLLLGDFGMSEHINSHVYGINKERGTFDYWCPEQTVESDEFGKFNHKADIWALGVLTYEITMGRPPFGSVLDNKTTSEILKSINKDHWTKRLKHFPREKSFSNELYKFIDHCLQKDGNKRPTAEALFEYDFIVKHNKDRLQEPAFKTQPYTKGTGFNCKMYNKN